MKPDVFYEAVRKLSPVLLPVVRSARHRMFEWNDRDDDDWDSDEEAERRAAEEDEYGYDCALTRWVSPFDLQTDP